MTQKFSLSSECRLWFTTTDADLELAKSCETFAVLLDDLKAELERAHIQWLIYCSSTSTARFSLGAQVLGGMCGGPMVSRQSRG